MTYANVTGTVIVVAYLIVNPTPWVAIPFAALGVLMQLRAIVKAGAEDPVKPREERSP